MLIRICKWIDEEDFRELLAILSYLGRENRCSIFYVNVGKLERKVAEGDNLDAFLSILGKYVEDTITLMKIRQQIEEIREKYSVVVDVDDSRKVYWLCSKLRLLDYLSHYRLEGGIRYDRVSRCFAVAPYIISRVMYRLRSEGITVRDKSGLIFSEKRHGLDDYELKVSLRPYQEEAIERWVNNGYTGVVALPTGAGKTIVGLAAIEKVKRPALIVVYTREQLHQWHDMVRRFTNIPSYMVHLFYGEAKSIGPITITTYQTAYRNTELLSSHFSLLIVDEVHHLPADKFRRIALEILAPFRLGLSATPYREDGRHEELFKFMGGLVYFVSQKELAEQGYLARFRIIPVYVTLTRKEREEYRQYYQQFIKVAGSTSFEDIVKLASSGVKEAREALSALSKARRLLLLSSNKVKKLEEIVREERDKGSKIIIFAQYVEVAEYLASRLGTYALTGKLSDEKRKRILSQFRSCSLDVLVMTTVGDEGLDLPDANVGIMLGVMGSRRQFVQRLGRLLRPGKGKEARLYVLAVKNTFEERQLKRKLAMLSELIEGLESAG